MSYAKVANDSLAGMVGEFELAGGLESQPNSVAVEPNATAADPLKSLLERKDLWRAGLWQGEHQAKQVGYPSGFAELDRHLADSGWPQQGVCEFLCHGTGQGELSIILPLLKRLINRTQANMIDSSELADPLVLMVAPPFVPYPRAFELQGIDVERLVWVDSHDRKEQLWAIEQALGSGTVPLVLAWLDHLSITESRRLQLAAEKGKALCILYLPSKVANDSHPVTLRLSLRREHYSAHKAQNQPLRAVTSVGDTRVDIIKRRGGWPSAEFSLSLLPAHLKQSLLGVESFLANSSGYDSDKESVSGLGSKPNLEGAHDKSGSSKAVLTLVTKCSISADEEATLALRPRHQLNFN